jgi:hypothetical protein
VSFGLLQHALHMPTSAVGCRVAVEVQIVGHRCWLGGGLYACVLPLNRFTLHSWQLRAGVQRSKSRDRSSHRARSQSLSWRPLRATISIRTPDAAQRPSV